ncbi:hypothetical protein [Frigoribacterium sp. Leaf164]|uniref:hypothetical protein n=1 Tax=Frigoribacterium sp. Leaf164 TaxID=1736282 RepID=UPI0012E10564|nr:hypothetical protein [Frigoribacterium sp. Leaf164]
MKTAAPMSVRVASLGVVVVGLTSLSGCSTNDTDTQRTTQGMVATAEVLDRFDGYLSVGLRVENSDEAVLTVTSINGGSVTFSTR